MPFDRNLETGKVQFSFTNFLALIISLACFTYLFWVAFVLSKAEASNNTTLIQVTTVVTATLTSIVMYYFGSSNSSAKQAAQITEMQRTATTVALAASNANVAAAANTAISAKTDIKVDKAVKIAELKAELEKLEPDSEDAKTILAQLEELEKKTN